MDKKQFKQKLHKLKSWILYCDENIRKTKRCYIEFDYHKEKYETQQKINELMSNYLKQ